MGEPSLRDEKRITSAQGVVGNDQSYGGCVQERKRGIGLPTMLLQNQQEGLLMPITLQGI